MESVAEQRARFEALRSRVGSAGVAWVQGAGMRRRRLKRRLVELLHKKILEKLATG